MSENPAKPASKPARPPALPALTGVRAFFAMNIVLFHFSDPKQFGFLGRAIDNGYAGVSFFFLLSGFVLGYNYAERAAAGLMDARVFWRARLTRLYPVYVLGLLLSLPTLRLEWGANTHGMFGLGAALTVLMQQAWVPRIGMFWNPPAWTLTDEVCFYALLPWLLTRFLPRMPKKVGQLVGVLAVLWLLSQVAPALYMYFNPDGIVDPGRYSWGLWLRAVKLMPVMHVFTFLFGVVLSRLHAVSGLSNRTRLVMAVCGLGLVFGCYEMGPILPYMYAHNGLLAPAGAVMILGLAGNHAVSRFLGASVFQRIGSTSYCLYIIHFSLWELLHAGFMQRTGLVRFDPWLSYAILLGAAYLAYRLVEIPGRGWMEKMLPARMEEAG